MKHRLILALIVLTVLPAVAVWLQRDNVSPDADRLSAGDTAASESRPRVSVKGLPATVRDRIRAALAARRIDYETSLLYRAYALFGDLRLPSEFLTGAIVGEDNAFFDEAEDNAGRLSPQLRSELTKYWVRPTHPDSVFNTSVAAPNRASVGDLLVRPLSAADNPCGLWFARRSRSSAVKVSACGPGATAAVDYTLAIFDGGLWDRMVALMGPPIADCGGATAADERCLAHVSTERDAHGGDDAIDIYVVPWGGPPTAPGGRNIEFTHERAIGFFRKASPFVGATSSGYVVIRSDLPPDEFRSTLVHELFHVLQSAHNREITKEQLPTESGEQQPRTFWFAEASAVWAESHFARDIAATAVHWERFTGLFQQSEHSLHDSTSEMQPYAAYIWPFFMEQERKSAEPIAQIWRDLRSAGTDWDRALDIIDRQLPFDTNFRVFARRNLNNDFGKPPGQRPIEPLYQGLDSAFPAGYLAHPAHIKPIDATRRLAAADSPVPYAVGHVPALRAAYFEFWPTNEVQQLAFEFGAVQPALNLDIDVVAHFKESNTYKLYSLARGETTLRFCRTWPDEDIDHVVLVLSNHSKDIAADVTGTFTAHPSSAPCACGTVDIHDHSTSVQRVVLNSVIRGDSTTTETRSGGYTVVIDNRGEVTSSGEVRYRSENNGVSSGPDSPLAKVSGTTNTTTTSVTSVVVPKGRLRLSPVAEDGTYTVEFCIGPTETAESTTVTNSRDPSANRSHTSRETNTELTCHMAQGTAPRDAEVLAGHVYSPRALQNPSSRTFDPNARSYDVDLPPYKYTGWIAGGWSASWHLGKCVPR